MTDKTSYIRQRILERNIDCCKNITLKQLEIITILSMEHDHYDRLQEERNKTKEDSAEEIEITLNGKTIAEKIKEKIKVFADGKEIKEPPLLSIKLENETAVPKVFYKGEEITLKRNVFFDWDTDTSNMGGLTYAIEHREVDSMGIPCINRIERRVKGHASD